MQTFKSLPIFFLQIFLLFSSLAFGQTQKGINFQAVIKSPTGDLVNKSGVSISVKLLSPNNCILREEEFTGVSINAGYLNLTIGNGTPNGNDPGLTLPKALDNSSTVSSLVCLNFDGSVNSNLTSYDPSSGNGTRKVRISMTIDSLPVEADFTMRSIAYAVNSDTLDGKKKDEFLQVNSTGNLTQAKLQEFITAITSVAGGSIKWNGTNFVSFDPTANDSIPATAIIGVPFNKISSVPTPLAQIGGLACADGKLLKMNAGNWSCGDESGVGTESDPTVQAFAKTTPGAGLELALGKIKVKESDFIPSCTSGQNIVWNSVSNLYVCQAISITKAQISDFPNMATVATSGDYNDLLNKPSLTSGNITSALGYTPQQQNSELTALGGMSSSGILKRTGAAAYSTLGLNSPLTDTGTAIGLSLSSSGALYLNSGSLAINLGTGLDINGTNQINVTYGTTAGTAAQGNDSRIVNAVQTSDARLPASNCGAGNFNRWNGSAWVCEADQNTGGGGGGGGSGITTWNVVTANTTMAVNQGYIANSASRIELALPATCTVGDMLAVNGINTGGWRITIPTSGVFIYGATFNMTSPGPNGFLDSNGAYGKDSVQLVCASSTIWAVANSSGSLAKNPTKQVFTYTGSNQTFTVPSYVTSIDVKIWGAGGGGPSSQYSSAGVNARGGGGGFVSGTIAVTGNETLTIMVGQGGGGAPASGTGASATYGGGGAGGTPTATESGAAGGGRSAILRSSTQLAVAGAGGGAGNYNTGAAGGGGGTAPENANYCAGANGGSATTSAAGSAGSACYGSAGSAGSGSNGGNGGNSGYYAGGGGGGGYYGGGGGGGIGSGGGGSNLVPAGGTGLSSTAGAATNTGDADYISGVAVGGSEGATGTSGGNGLIVISW